MTKTKYRARCQSCGYETPKWLGRCPDCGEWNTFVEEALPSMGAVKHLAVPSENAMTMPLTELTMPDETRLATGILELDRVLGGGIVSGGLILIGGEPGIGKSTLLLQVAAGFVRNGGHRAMIVSGEESPAQIKMRALRLDAVDDRISILSATDMNQIEFEVNRIKPDLLIVDSIQTVYNPMMSSSPGSVSQVRECTAALLHIAKRQGLPICITGHVTKSGSIAGPRVLEHIVDVVLYFEGERSASHRMIRGFKNRYGSTNEIGIFEMTSQGLKQIDNPSSLFLGDLRAETISGAAVLATIEGSRSMLVEIQALASPSYSNIVRRLSAGFDYNRMLLLLAVLERRAGIRCDKSDIYTNTTGGLKVDEPGGDLAVAVAIASSLREAAIPRDMVCFGELSLSGEVRPVTGAGLRIKEAEKLGFTKVMMSEHQVKDIEATSVELIKVGDISSALAKLEI